MALSDLNPFKKKPEEAKTGEGEHVAKIDVFESESDLEIQVRQKEKGQKVDIAREPVRGGISRSSGSAEDYESAARIRELLFHPDEDNLEMLAVTKKQHWTCLAAAQTFDDVRSMGEGRRNGNYVSVAKRFITHFDKRSISVQGNVSDTRNAMLQVHQDMTSSDEKNNKSMPMG